MPYLLHPNVSDEFLAIENGKTVLVAETTVVLDCCNPRFSLWARNTLEREQYRAFRRFGFDEVRLVQI
jgi:hypothetical protein